jgi:hypothetical protein
VGLQVLLELEPEPVLVLLQAQPEQVPQQVSVPP